MRIILFIISAISFTFCASKNQINDKVKINTRKVTDSIKRDIENKEDIELLKLKMFIGSQKI